MDFGQEKENSLLTEEQKNKNQGEQIIQQANNKKEQMNSQREELLEELEGCSKDDIIKKYIFLKQENEILRKQASGDKPSQAKIESGEKTKKMKKDEKTEKKKEKLFDLYQQQHFALKMSYVGVNYQGLAYQVQTDNTVEEQLFRALEKTTLIQHRDKCNFTRSGRTDKGVSALGQVIGITLRTSIKITEDANQQENKLDYIKMINSILPEEIRILSCKKVDSTFNARFDCVKRIYKYFFFENSMSIDLIKEGAKLFIGEHDFRNYCKIDVLQTTNYVRIIHQLDIDEVHSEIGSNDPRTKLYVATIVGSAFLWHQIRNIMAILFLVGKKLEPPTIVSELLDIENNPSKPNYEMAADFPLILFDCLYDKVKFDYAEEQIRMYDHFLYILEKRQIENQLYLAPLNYIAKMGEEQNYNIIQNSIITEERNQKSKKYQNLLTRKCAFTSEESMKNLKGRKLDKFLTKKEKQINYQQNRENQKKFDELQENKLDENEQNEQNGN